MKKFTHHPELLVPFCLCLLLGACSEDPKDVASGGTDAAVQESLEQGTSKDPDDLIARVGDQIITYSEINTMMNSSAIVGLSMPELGTPERDTVRLTLLDKHISANLLYLDALKQGVDQDPVYQQDLKLFSDAILASLYRQKFVVENIEVTDAEIQDFFDNSIALGTEFTEEVGAGIEATIRKERFKASMAALRLELREGVEVVVDEEELNPEDDEVRVDTTAVASVDGKTITWGEVKGLLGTPVNAGSMENRLKALNGIIDNRLMTRKARAAGLEQDPAYQARIREYRKTRLINLHRNRLLQEMEPTEGDLATYFEAHREQIVVPEVRDVQMVVLKTREEAAGIKQRIESGELTVSKAAAEYSTVPDSPKTLGKVGWVSKGSGFPELDKVTFALAPDEIGGPVESLAGWHVVKVLDMRDAAHESLEDDRARQETRRLLVRDRLNQYVIDLRKQDFTVEIYEDTIAKYSQQEIDWYQEAQKTRQLSPEEVKAQIEKLRK
jgi:parvulin-like peptidyl-prolyl isomerase